MANQKRSWDSRWFGMAVTVATLACTTATPAQSAPQLEPSRSPALPAAQPQAVAIGGAAARRVAKRWETQASGKGTAVAIHRKLSRVAASFSSSVKIFDFKTGKPLRTLASCGDVVRGGLAFAKQNLVVTCGSAIEVFDVRRLRQSSGPTMAESKATASSFVYPKLAVGHHDGVVRIYDLAGGDTVEIPVPGPPIDVKSIALSPDKKTVAVAWVQGSIWWWNVAEPKMPHKLVRYPNESDCLAFSPNSKYLAEEGRSRHTTLWRWGSAPSAERTIPNGAWVKRMLFTKDGQWLARGGSDGVELAGAVDGERLKLVEGRNVEDIALDEQSASLAAVDRKGRLILFEVR